MQELSEQVDTAHSKVLFDFNVDGLNYQLLKKNSRVLCEVNRFRSEAIGCRGFARVIASTLF